MPIWAKVLVGSLVIVGVAVAAVLTGGLAETIAGSALAGAIVNGALGVASGITLDENGWTFGYGILYDAMCNEWFRNFSGWVIYFTWYRFIKFC